MWSPYVLLFLHRSPFVNGCVRATKVTSYYDLSTLCVLVPIHRSIELSICYLTTLYQL